MIQGVRICFINMVLFNCWNFKVVAKLYDIFHMKLIKRDPEREQLTVSYTYIYLRGEIVFTKYIQVTWQEFKWLDKNETVAIQSSVLEHWPAQSWLNVLIKLLAYSLENDMHDWTMKISMGYCKKLQCVTPVSWQWSYAFLALIIDM